MVDVWSKVVEFLTLGDLLALSYVNKQFAAEFFKNHVKRVDVVLFVNSYAPPPEAADFDWYANETGDANRDLASAMFTDISEYDANLFSASLNAQSQMRRHYLARLQKIRRICLDFVWILFGLCLEKIEKSAEIY